MQEILKLIETNGAEALMIALTINFLTGITKKPLKALSKKMKDGTKLTRFIVFLPVVFGGILTAAYEKIALGGMTANRDFFMLWVTSSSLSLTFYAFFEKLFPKKEKLMEKEEIEENRKLLGELKKLIEPQVEEGLSKNEEQADNSPQKIILRGNANANNEEVGTKKESL